MSGSKHRIYNKELPRSDFSFQIFEEMAESALNVMDEANYLIKRRKRLKKFPHNRTNWRNFDLVTRNRHLPRFMKDRTFDQKRLGAVSLHEYLQSCR